MKTKLIIFLAAIIKNQTNCQQRDNSPNFNSVHYTVTVCCGWWYMWQYHQVKKRRYQSLSSMVLLWESLLISSVYHNPSLRQIFKELWITIPTQLLGLFNKFWDIKKQKNFQRTCLPSFSNSRVQACQRLLWNILPRSLMKRLKMKYLSNAFLNEKLVKNSLKTSPMQGLPLQARGLDSALPRQGPQAQSCVLCGVKRKEIPQWKQSFSKVRRKMSTLPSCFYHFLELQSRQYRE